MLECDYVTFLSLLNMQVQYVILGNERVVGGRLCHLLNIQRSCIVTVCSTYYKPFI